MGFFGTYLFADDVWAEVDHNTPIPSPDSGSWLYLDIHDSDVATVRYQPHGDATGIAFLGTTPRVYFEDEEASAPTDRAAEAGALVDWARSVTGADVTSSAVENYLAADDDVEPDESVELDDLDIFVEVKSAKFCRLLGLPAPPQLD